LVRVHLSQVRHVSNMCAARKRRVILTSRADLPRFQIISKPYVASSHWQCDAVFFCVCVCADGNRAGLAAFLEANCAGLAQPAMLPAIHLLQCIYFECGRFRCRRPVYDIAQRSAWLASDAVPNPMYFAVSRRVPQDNDVKNSHFDFSKSDRCRQFFDLVLEFCSGRALRLIKPSSHNIPNPSFSRRLQTSI